MSFGYSVGDVIAIAGLIERIVSEVKSYREAPLHFQRLAIELDFLSQVCVQVFALRPSDPDELAHIERIRAIALQCLGPLRTFEDKMKGYENTLGQQFCNARGPQLGGFRKRKRFTEKLADFKHRLHWSAIGRHEVDELRAILTSEILAINTLLTTHEWTSLKAQRAFNQNYVSQLRRLVETTEAASVEIKKFLVDAKVASERLEQLILSGNMTQAEQVRFLSTISEKSTQTNKIVKGLSKRDRKYTSGVQETVNNAQAQIVKLFSLTQYLEDWIKKIVQYCKELISMVQRNTEILLSLHGMLTKFELLLSRSRVDLPSIIFENVFGIKMILLYQLCNTFNAFSRLLGCMFFNKPGLKLVEAGRFLIMYSDSNRIITPQLWSSCVVPGDQLSMSMVLQRVSPRACPRCQVVLPNTPNIGAGGVTCPSCSLWVSTAEAMNLTGGVSVNAEAFPIPPPPAEKIRLQTSSWSGRWDSGYIKEQALQRQARLRRNRIRDNAVFGLSSTFDGDEVASFRRIHVISYEGDILKGLVETGEKLRDLMIELSADSSSQDPNSLTSFESRFKNILSDFNKLKDTNILPLLELRKRSSRDSRSRSGPLENWIRKTSQILMNAPFKFDGSQEQIMGVCSWLLGERENVPSSSRAFTPTNVYKSLYPQNTEGAQALFDHYHNLLNPNSLAKDISKQKIESLRPVYDAGISRWGLLNRGETTDTPAPKPPRDPWSLP